MGFFKEVIATGLADKLYKYGFEKIGRNWWAESAEIGSDESKCAYLIVTIYEYDSKFDIAVHSPLHSHLDTLASGNSPRIWQSKGYHSFEEALGVITKHVRICQNKFPHILFYKEVSHQELNKPPADLKGMYQEFLNNRWVLYPKSFSFYDHYWQSLRSVQKKCDLCTYFEYGWNGDEDKLFSIEKERKNCQDNFKFMCLREPRH
jgi:hypothetical protein